MDYNINFPNLHIYLEHVGKEIIIGNYSIAYYGVMISLGMLAGLSISCWMAKKTGQDMDTYLDFGIIAILCSIAGARLYYVIFRWDLYKDDFLSIFNIRQGGLAIYGGVLAGILSAFLYAKAKKLPMGLLCDTAGIGLVLGQAIGRWGNFFNREVFGGYSTGLFAMQLPMSAVRSSDISLELAENVIHSDVAYIQVHPTFLYESVWNLLLTVFLVWFTKRKRFDGEVFLLYLLGYGIGRFWIESIRTDQLYLPGTKIPVSMLLAAFLSVLSLVWIIVWHVRNPKGKTVSSNQS